MEVAGRARPVGVRLGHEREPVAVLPGDLLGAVLEDHAPVGRLQDLVVADVDLVLDGAASPLLNSIGIRASVIWLRIWR